MRFIWELQGQWGPVAWRSYLPLPWPTIHLFPSPQPDKRLTRFFRGVWQDRTGSLTSPVTDAIVKAKIANSDRAGILIDWNKNSRRSVSPQFQQQWPVFSSPLQPAVSDREEYVTVNHYIEVSSAVHVVFLNLMLSTSSRNPRSTPPGVSLTLDNGHQLMSCSPSPAFVFFRRINSFDRGSRSGNIQTFTIVCSTWRNPFMILWGLTTRKMNAFIVHHEDRYDSCFKFLQLFGVYQKSVLSNEIFVVSVTLQECWLYISMRISSRGRFSDHCSVLTNINSYHSLCWFWFSYSCLDGCHFQPPKFIVGSGHSWPT